MGARRSVESKRHRVESLLYRFLNGNVNVKSQLAFTDQLYTSPHRLSLRDLVWLALQPAPVFEWGRQSRQNLKVTYFKSSSLVVHTETELSFLLLGWFHQQSDRKLMEEHQGLRISGKLSWRRSKIAAPFSRSKAGAMLRNRGTGRDTCVLLFAPQGWHLEEHPDEVCPALHPAPDRR